MKFFQSLFFPTCLHLVPAHLLPNSCLGHRSTSSPLGIWALCGRRSRPSPGHYKLLTKHNLCCWVGACDITSSPWGSVGSRAGSSSLCVQSQSTLCTRPGSSCHVTSIVHRSGLTTLAFSHYEVVWEKHSLLVMVREFNQRGMLETHEIQEKITVEQIPTVSKLLTLTHTPASVEIISLISWKATVHSSDFSLHISFQQILTTLHKYTKAHLLRFLGLC